MKKLNEFQIIDHGVDNCQYFQGCGVANTGYIGVATGVGNSAHEALEDALEQLAQMDWDVSKVNNKLSKDIDVPDNADDTYHYVSVRVN